MKLVLKSKLKLQNFLQICVKSFVNIHNIFRHLLFKYMDIREMFNVIKFKNQFYYHIIIITGCFYRWVNAVFPKVCSADHQWSARLAKWSANLYKHPHFVLRGALKWHLNVLSGPHIEKVWEPLG